MAGQVAGDTTTPSRRDSIPLWLPPPSPAARPAGMPGFEKPKPAWGGGTTGVYRANGNHPAHTYTPHPRQEQGVLLVVLSPESRDPPPP